MPQFLEIDGPLCHLQVFLKNFLSPPAEITIKMDCDLAMTYTQYVRSVLHSVSLCGPQVHLEIRLLAYYDLNVLDRVEMKSLASIALPEVASLNISFPCM